MLALLKLLYNQGYLPKAIRDCPLVHAKVLVAAEI